MAASGINHASVTAIDLDESVEFYVSVFGMERIPTYTFAFPTQFLRLGDQQLHIFERPASAPVYHHIGINVDDYESLFRRAKDLDIFDRGSFGSHIYELPDGSVQFYLRDPGGNLIECDWPDVSTLNREVFGDIPRLADAVTQRPESEGATLFLSGAKPA